MIDEDLIVSKEDYLKNDLIIALREKLNDINKNNIDNSILEIQNILKEFILLNEECFNMEETILNNRSIDNLINSMIEIKSYNLKNTSFIKLSDFLRDSLITVGAESSVGKTSFASQLALEILENNDDTILAFYSLDDSKTFLIKKMILQLLGKNIKKKYYEDYKDNDFIKLIKKHKNDYLKLLLSGRIAIFENLNIYNLYSQLLKLKRNAVNNLNITSPRIIVIIDYLQIINHESNNLREGLNKICSFLKDIQKNIGCMMILLSQFNRSKETNINTLIRYRETSEIENVSDLCINLESIQNQNSYNTKLYIVKNKAGEKNKVFSSLRDGFIFNKFVEITENRTLNTYETEKTYNNEMNYDTESIDDFIF